MQFPELRDHTTRCRSKYSSLRPGIATSFVEVESRAYSREISCRFRRRNGDETRRGHCAVLFRYGSISFGGACSRSACTITQDANKVLLMSESYPYYATGRRDHGQVRTDIRKILGDDLQHRSLWGELWFPFHVNEWMRSIWRLNFRCGFPFM